MTRYEWQYHRPNKEGRFDVKGRIVHVDPTGSPSRRGCYCLVELPEGSPERSDVPATFDSLPERVARTEPGIDVTETENTIEEDVTLGTVTCSGRKADGSPCTREVDEAGDRCWQHEED